MENSGKTKKDMEIFVPSLPYKAGFEHGILSEFEPGIKTLPKGFQLTPQFKPLPVNIIFEKDVAVTLRDGITIYTDIFRPEGDAKVPVIIAWSPYWCAQKAMLFVTQTHVELQLPKEIARCLEDRKRKIVMI
jgi:predicted acyl esterase